MESKWRANAVWLLGGWNFEMKPRPIRVARLLTSAPGSGYLVGYSQPGLMSFSEIVAGTQDQGRSLGFVVDLGNARFPFGYEVYPDDHALPEFPVWI